MFFRLTVARFTRQFESLFKGNPEFLQGINLFLPSLSTKEGEKPTIFSRDKLMRVTLPIIFTYFRQFLIFLKISWGMGGGMGINSLHSLVKISYQVRHKPHHPQTLR